MTPWAPRRPCAWPRCPKYAVPGKPRCEEHQVENYRRRNAARNPAVQAFYNSVAWKRLRALKRQMTPYCEFCMVEHRLTPVQQVDHIETVAKRPDLALVIENTRSLCMHHHSQRTMTDQNRYRNS